MLEATGRDLRKLVGNHQNRKTALEQIAKEVVASLPLEVFKERLDMVCRDMFF